FEHSVALVVAAPCGHAGGAASMRRTSGKQRRFCTIRIPSAALAGREPRAILRQLVRAFNSEVPRYAERRDGAGSSRQQVDDELTMVMKKGASGDGELVVDL